MSLSSTLEKIAVDAAPVVERLIADIGSHPPATQVAIAERLAFVLAEETASDLALNKLLEAAKRGL